MANRTNPFTTMGRPAYEGPHFMPFDVEGRATQHEFNRERTVTAVLMELFIMAVKRIVPKDSVLSLGGAVSQSLEGTEGTHAAHCVPRQLFIKGKTASDVLRKSFPERGYVLDCLFSETDILPANFNHCDSRAERNGLNVGFLRACEISVFMGYQIDKLAISSIVGAVTENFSTFRKNASTAFQFSINRLDEKLRAPFASPNDVAKWTVQRDITKYYSQTLQESPGHAKALDIGIVAGLINLYNEL